VSPLEEPVSAAPEARAESPLVRQRTQYGLGPGAVEATSPFEGLSQTVNTTREPPEARAETTSFGEGKVIPFPAQRRDDEAQEVPAEPAPAARDPEPSPHAPSELRTVPRESSTSRSNGPGGTQRLELTPLPPPVTTPPSQPTPLGAITATLGSVGVPSSKPVATSSQSEPPPPSSSRSRDAAGARGFEHPAARVSEDHFFKIGDAGEYEGGPSHRPPPIEVEEPEEELHHSIRVRTPEQEQRRAQFIRWVVAAMGFGIAVFLMGIVLRVVAPAPKEDATKLEHPVPPPAVAEPTPVATEPATAAVVPPPPVTIEAPVETQVPEPEAPPAATTPPATRPAPEAAAKPALPKPLPAAPAVPKGKPALAEAPAPAPPAKHVEAKGKPVKSPAAATTAGTAPAGTASFPVD
jgi:hypothetical protein